VSGRARVGVVAVAVVLLVTGCTAGVPHSEATPTPVEKIIPVVPSASPSPSLVAAQERDLAPEGQYNLGSTFFATLVDSGPRKGAKGTTTINSDGELASYTVAAGDEFEAIIERFGIEAQVLINLNTVRRVNFFYLYTDDILNLDPHTITSVGTENGKFANNPLPDPHPEQR